MKPRGIIGSLVLLASVTIAGPGDVDPRDVLWEAARRGDLATLKRLQAEGVDLDARTRYGASALSYACDKGHLEVVRFLLDNGVETDVSDSFYEFTPIGWALFKEHDEIVKLLLDKGAAGADRVLTTAAERGNADLVQAALGSGQVDADDVALALEKAAALEDPGPIVELLNSAEVPAVERAPVEVEPSRLAAYAGKYGNDEVGMTIEVRLEEGELVAQATNQQPLRLRALSVSRFEPIEAPQIKLEFAGRSGIVERLLVEQGGQTTAFPRVTETAATEPADEDAGPEAAPSPTPVERTAARNWPSFRGAGAAGVADGQGAPAEWNVETGQNVRWKTPIPGLANSSPIIWGERVFVTTAISGAGDDTFRTGLYGDVDSVDDESEHEFRIYALSTTDGSVVWQRTVSKAVPGAKRHMKSTQANSTPVTDGRRVVALFGTVGLLIAFDLDGEELWRTDLGILDAGWFYDRSYQWGHASSPVIHGELVIVQADVYAGSFIAAYRLSDGKLAWKTEREDVPSWGTPTVVPGDGRHELVANGKTIKGYDPATGKELWTLAPNSEVTVATPIAAHGLTFVTAGYPPVRPIYAIRPGSVGDISLPESEESSEAIAWSRSRGGTYMPTPIVYGEYLYTCANDGRLTCYRATTGEQVYRARIGGGGRSFTASPVAADGRLYFTEESGAIHVIQAGPAYVELGSYEMGGVCMSTPAISDGLMVVRTLDHVFGLGPAKKPGSSKK